ncbi:MAG: hypothetical protein JRI25_27160 [Deltaproteobacteria bacterium]|nr:hypothetical protein [Deltaproteobacteria bacterium]
MFVPTYGGCLLMLCGPDDVYRGTLITDGSVSLGATLAPPDLVFGSRPHRLRLEAELAGVVGLRSENGYCDGAISPVTGTSRLAVAPLFGMGLTWFPGTDVGFRIGANHRYYIPSHEQGDDIEVLNVHGEFRLQVGVVFGFSGGG